LATRLKIRWLVCAKRRFNLVVVLRLPRFPANDEEEKALAPLFIPGPEAAKKVRSMAHGKEKTHSATGSYDRTRHRRVSQLPSRRR
jgi:hypothetical protein